jgi:alcohol dehydrogenase class IV
MQHINPFQSSQAPRILFAAGGLSRLADECSRYGENLLLVSGRHSLQAAGHLERLHRDFRRLGLRWQQVRIDTEPTVEMIDGAVARHRHSGIDTVIGIGGGSALDAAKAIAGLLPSGAYIMDHLEGVGAQRPYQGPALPWIAVPTTAGTGSEATRNAVITGQGPNGFKKSFRDDRLVASLALIDPDLLIGCPQQQLAANGMDALTQLLESFVSTRANPISRSLALTGMEHFRDGFPRLWETAGEDPWGRQAAAMASLLSGLCLANTGLGAVHGLAAPLGALHPIPHGVACGTLLAETVALNIRALEQRLPDSPALDDFARLGRLLNRHTLSDDQQARASLIAQLRDWTQRWQLPRLGPFGLQASDIPAVVAGARGSSMQTNPLPLTDPELADLLRQRL